MISVFWLHNAESPRVNPGTPTPILLPLPANCRADTRVGQLTTARSGCGSGGAGGDRGCGEKSVKVKLLLESRDGEYLPRVSSLTWCGINQKHL